MPDPLRLTKSETEHMFADATRSLGDILEELAPRRVVRLGRVDRTKRDADEEAAGPVRRSAPLVDSETTSFGTRN
jgi:hypothetical protein